MALGLPCGFPRRLNRANKKPWAVALVLYFIPRLEDRWPCIFPQNKEPRKKERGFFSEVMALGFEPRTACLEGRCSIQLSYATNNTVV